MSWSRLEGEPLSRFTSSFDFTAAVETCNASPVNTWSNPATRSHSSTVISVNGTRMFSNTGATAYACSKAAQVAFTKMLALELASSAMRERIVATLERTGFLIRLDNQQYCLSLKLARDGKPPIDATAPLPPAFHDAGFADAGP